MSYVERVLEELERKNPAQPEFIQAATEVLTSLEPVIEKHPEFEKAALLERIVEPVAEKISATDEEPLKPKRKRAK